MRSGQSVRLAVDIGGTFTDVVLEEGARRTISKVLTTPEQPELGFLEGVSLAIAKAGVAPGDIDLIVHGTTLATNALIERKGAKVGLLCTRGFRDTLEMAYEHRFEQSDVFMRRHHVAQPHWYLWMLGVDPQHQGRGLGSELLRSLNAKADVRAATLRPLTCARALRISSEMPSAKGPCVASPLMLAKGSTAMDSRGVPAP